MARYTRLIISCLLLSFSLHAYCALDAEDDPTLDVIRAQDREEIDTLTNPESLQCKNPEAKTNKVKLLSGEPWHMGTKVHVECLPGLEFVNGMTSANVSCTPAPHPCMCIALWSTYENLLNDLNCTGHAVNPPSSEDRLDADVGQGSRNVDVNIKGSENIVKQRQGYESHNNHEDELPISRRETMTNELPDEESKVQFQEDILELNEVEQPEIKPMVTPREETPEEFEENPDTEEVEEAEEDEKEEMAQAAREEVDTQTTEEEVEVEEDEEQEEEQVQDPYSNSSTQDQELEEEEESQDEKHNIMEHNESLVDEEDYETGLHNYENRYETDGRLKEETEENHLEEEETNESETEQNEAEELEQENFHKDETKEFVTEEIEQEAIKVEENEQEGIERAEIEHEETEQREYARDENEEEEPEQEDSDEDIIEEDETEREENEEEGTEREESNGEEVEGEETEQEYDENNDNIIRNEYNNEERNGSPDDEDEDENEWNEVQSIREELKDMENYEEDTNRIEPSFIRNGRVKGQSVIMNAIIDTYKPHATDEEDPSDETVEQPGWFEDVQKEPVEETEQPDVADTEEFDGKDQCSLPVKTGPCRMYFQRYFFNPSTKECELFVYGGCQGNANNFKSLKSCIDTCGSNTYP